jgi:GTP-binding protein EngB required for normal cell division
VKTCLEHSQETCAWRTENLSEGSMIELIVGKVNLGKSTAANSFVKCKQRIEEMIVKGKQSRFLERFLCIDHVPLSRFSRSDR